MLMVESVWLIRDLVETLESDPWRVAHGFSGDIESRHAVLFDHRKPRAEKITSLCSWLSDAQPCLFGRIEARQGRLVICLLTDHDLERSDRDIRAKIQQHRLDWKRIAISGASHGLLIVVLSEKVARARPNAALHRFASRLCELYLGVEASNAIHLDELILRIETEGSPVWHSWKVGVNYFSAQGDGRWWHDHRFPGGMAFSMNSVGHMARTRAEEAIKRDPSLLKRIAEVPREKLVYFALPTAMKTIGPPCDGSTRGTWLVPRGTFSEDIEPPTFEQRQRCFGELATYSENRYRGLYHTDHTIPSSYFDEGLWERERLPARDDLYFTYLHSRADADYQAMGLGVEIHVEGKSAMATPPSIRSERK